MSRQNRSDEIVPRSVVLKNLFESAAVVDTGSQEVFVCLVDDITSFFQRHIEQFVQVMHSTDATVDGTVPDDLKGGM